LIRQWRRYSLNRLTESSMLFASFIPLHTAPDNTSSSSPIRTFESRQSESARNRCLRPLCRTQWIRDAANRADVSHIRVTNHVSRILVRVLNTLLLVLLVLLVRLVKFRRNMTGNHLCRAHKTENIKQRTTRNIVVVNRHRSPAGPLNNLISCPPLTFEKILWKTISPGSHRCQVSIFQKDNVVLLSCALMRRPPGVADANLLACKWDASVIVRHAESYLQD
jgi:hypothetical protein